MSWETNKTSIVTALRALGYTEMPRNINAEDSPDSLRYMHFTLDVVDIETNNITSNGLLDSDIVELNIAYKMENQITKEELVDKFRTVIRTINALNVCISLVPNSYIFDKLTRDKYIATQRFIIGLTC